MNQNGICLPHKVSTVKSAKVSDHHKILNSHVSVVYKLLCDCALLKGGLRRFLSVFCFGYKIPSAADVLSGLMLSARQQEMSPGDRCEGRSVSKIDLNAFDRNLSCQG